MKSKTLYLIRHAKAEDHSFQKRDYDRNLVSKGIERAKLIADKLKLDLPSAKTLVISSSANRAIQTADIFCEIFNYPKFDIRHEKSIYEAHYKDILTVINSVANDMETVLVFGHNPGLSDLANYICNTHIDLKTAHVAKINLEKDFFFRELSSNTGYLEKVITE